MGSKYGAYNGSQGYLQPCAEETSRIISAERWRAVQGLNYQISLPMRKLVGNVRIEQPFIMRLSGTLVQSAH